ncbi:MAG TPA: TrkH family potassium uptake protein [Spirochaetota bacterium]|nr:TrkH family potassium uptake protein [Spirochaetota bacterium]
MRNRLFKLSPIQTVLLSFVSLIIAGAVLLKLPFSTTGEGISFVDSLFTSTSAVCVTGLVVKDTAKDFTLFGRTIIALLIQFGGLGIMTFSLAMAAMFKDSLSIKWRFTFADMYSDIRKIPVRNLVGRIVLYTFFFEAIIALVLLLQFARDFPFPQALGHSVFHSVSAFCNAGFSTFPDSMVSYRGNAIVNTGIMLAILMGGLGFLVIHELRRQFATSFNRSFFSGLSHHTRLVLVMTAILVFGGALIIFMLEFGFSMRDYSAGETVLASLFQSVTCRTAGFNSMDIGALRQSTQFFMMVLMFIGGSPGSIAGGVKTTTIAVAMIMLYAKFKGRNQPLVWHRAIDGDTVDRSTTLIILSLMFVLLSTFLVMVIDNFGLRESFLSSLFEVVSAFGTVGLSMGATAKLTIGGKLLICLVMYVGRLGPLTLIMALTAKNKDVSVQYPEEHIMIG